MTGSITNSIKTLFAFCCSNPLTQTISNETTREGKCPGRGRSQRHDQREKIEVAVAYFHLLMNGSHEYTEVK